MYKSAVLWIKKNIDKSEYLTVRTVDGKFINLKPNPVKRPGDNKPDYVEIQKLGEPLEKVK